MDIKVTPPVKAKAPTFADVKDGAVFMGHSTRDAYVKIRPIYTSSNGVRNAVRLYDGSAFHFTDGSEISVPKQAQLRIEE